MTTAYYIIGVPPQRKARPTIEQPFCYLVACVMQHQQEPKACNHGQDNPRQPPII